ncbi:MAG: methionine adenosyltransferase domain-containing protein [Patescibacteria group bacterium]
MIKAVEANLAGHPDKICDAVVEAVVDEFIRRDHRAHLDIQALGSKGVIMLGGAVDSKADFDVTAIAKTAYRAIGYEDELEFFVNLERPEATLNSGTGAGTAIVHGFATKETRELLPRASVYAQMLARKIDQLRLNDPDWKWLRPDGKIQLVMDGEQVKALTLILSHAPEIEVSTLRTKILTGVITPILGECEGAQFYINPGGEFVKTGFALNAGVSGRKSLADSYSGLLPHGGGSMVGKDPGRPVRAGMFMARYVARQLVKEGVTTQAFVTVVYGLGLAEPIALQALGEAGQELTELIKPRFDFRIEAILERFNLLRPIYASFVNYGMFGRSDVPWEE